MKSIGAEKKQRQQRSNRKEKKRRAIKNQTKKE
jgi:hypothetical protein